MLAQERELFEINIGKIDENWGTGRYRSQVSGSGKYIPRGSAAPSISGTQTSDPGNLFRSLYNGIISYVLETLDDLTLSTADTLKQWFSEKFPWLSKMYGYIDGPFNEDEVDEIIFIEKDLDNYSVISRIYTEKERGIFKPREFNGQPLTSVDQLEFDDEGNIIGCESIGGKLRSGDFHDFYDADFDLYGSSFFFKSYKDFQSELESIHREYIKDSLRYVVGSGMAENIGKDPNNRNVYVYRTTTKEGKKQKFGFGQSLYFLGLELSLGMTMRISKEATDLVRSALPILPKKIEKGIRKRFKPEPYLLRRYEEWSETFNTAIGLPKNIEMISLN